MISYVISASPFAPCHASMYIVSFAWLNLRKTPYYSHNRSFAILGYSSLRINHKRARNKTTRKLYIDNTLFISRQYFSDCDFKLCAEWVADGFLVCRSAVCDSASVFYVLYCILLFNSNGHKRIIMLQYVSYYTRLQVRV